MLDLTQALPGGRSEAPHIETRSVSVGVARGTLVLYAMTLFVSSALLFLVQPMFAKMVLPMLGGTPAVWNTCMVFFQAMLLAGYLYAHASTRWLGVRGQACLQVGLVLLPLIVLPIGIEQSWFPRPDVNPIPWLLALLLVTVGLPFFVVSTSAPLLQKWFARTGHPSARDPYFLYTASNCGSVMALMAYPALIEPTLALADQSWVWAVGYGTLAALTMGCAVTVWRLPVAGAHDRSMDLEDREVRPSLEHAQAAQHVAPPLAIGRRFQWVALAFVPSSLLLGVTTYLSTDIAAVPLLWTVPLILYSFTFVLAFAASPPRLNVWMVRALPYLALPLLVLTALNTTQPARLLIPLHLLTFFAAAIACHGRLASDRPSTEHLTEFYLWLAVGGVLGGLFNALFAPVVFTRVVEYPLAMVLACMLRPRTGRRRHQSLWLDFALPVALTALGAALLFFSRVRGVHMDVPVLILLFGLPSLLCFGFADRPIRLGLGVGIILLVSTAYPARFGKVQHTMRSFFGVHRVSMDGDEKHRLLFHGSTLHGLQSLDMAKGREPLSYYHRSGPIGQLFAALEARSAPENIAVLGLGSGSLAAYGKSGQGWTFYEIDPTVERIARSDSFTFLRDSPAKINVVLGDGRLSLRHAPPRHYSLIILDAFSSDSLPVHLLTRESMKLYLSKLAEGGVLVFNISNRFLRLRPMLATLAQDSGLIAVAQADLLITETQARDGKTGSEWLVMARNASELGSLTRDPRWTDVAGEASGKVWTDDFSNILSVVKWR